MELINALTNFYLEWENDKIESGKNCAAEAAAHPLKADTVSGTNTPLVDPAEVVKPAASRKRSSGKKPEETESTRPVVTETPSAALPVWLQEAQNTAPTVDGNPFGQANPVADPALAWLNTPAPTPFVAPEPVIQQHPALLDQIAEIGKLIGTDDKKRAKAMEYLNWLGVDSISKIVPERQAEALSTMQQIYSGQIAS